MAARGSILKQEITKKILEAFPGSFVYNGGKEIRINGTENGENLQVKVTLTCAKVAVDVEGGGVDASTNNSSTITTNSNSEIPEKIPQEPSEEEKERLTTLLKTLGL